MAWIHDQRGFLVVFVCKKIGDAKTSLSTQDGTMAVGKVPTFWAVTLLHHSVTVLHHPPGYRRHLCSILYCVKQCNGQCVIWWFPHFGQLHHCYTTSLLHCTVTPQASPPPPVLHEPPLPSLQQVTCLQNVVQVPSGKDL